MAKYLRLFNTHENYKTELQSGKLELSNVSLISREKSIQYERNSPNILKCTYEISQQDFDDNTELVSSFGGIPLMVNADSYLHGYKINGEEVIIDPLTKLDLGGGIIEYEYLDNKYIPKSNYRIKFSEEITEFLILLDDNSDIDNIINNYYISAGILDGNDNILEDEWICQTLTEAVYQNQLLILDDVNNILQLSGAFLSALGYMEETAPGGSMFISLVDQPYVDSGGQTIPSINTKIQKYFTSGGIGNITVADPGKYTLEYDFNYSGIQDIVFNIYGIAHEAFSHLITRFDSSKLLPIPELNYIIPTNLFEYNSNLNKLILENITQINPHAIYSCNNLTKLTIPNSVIEIGEDNFKECNNLKEIIIDCEIIKSSWFQDNTTIESIILGPNVKIIESNAFAGCTSLHYIHISQSLKFIGENAFGGCENLKNIDVFDIDSWCNIDFENINSNPLSINSGVLSINGEEANSIKISGKTMAIKKNAFYGCSNIVMVTLYNGVESIEENAFYRCSNLLSVTIPSSMKNIKNGAFGECGNLEFMSFPNKEDNIITLDLNCAIDTTPWYQSWIRKNHHDGLLYLESWLVKHIGLIPEKSSIEVREGTNIIMEGAFLYEDGKDFTGQPNLININLPTSLEYIKSYAFYNCTGLKSLIITENIVEIMQGAFMECINLKVLINKSGLDLQLGSEEHGYVAYYANKLIDNIDNIIDGYIFEKINSISYLSDYIGDGVNLILPSDYLGGNYQIKENALKNREDIVSINSLENSKLTKINNNAFYGCSNLISVSIPQNVTSIGEDALYGCNSLERVTINCATIGDWFSELTSIKEVVLGEGVTSIGTRAFHNCSGLTSVNIPKQVTSIGTGAFYGCRSLNAVHISSIDSWIKISFHSSSSNPLYYAHNLYLNGKLVTELVIPKGVMSIGQYTFYGCSSLTSITIPESVISIGNSSFDGCSNLAGVYINNIEDWCNITFGTEYANPLSYSHKLFLNGELIEDLNIPVGVTTLKDHVFAGNTFKSITLPKTLTSLGVNSFGWSVMESEYESTTCYAVNPPQSTENSFYVTHVNKPLYVPYQSIEAYKTAEYWGKFTNIQPILIASGTCGDDLTWVLTGEYELMIEGTGDMYTYSLRGTPWSEYHDAILAITLLEGVTSIGWGAFKDCSKLTKIIISESVTSIGEDAFYGCSSLTSITCHAAIPPTIAGLFTFHGVDKSIPVHVPEESVDAYRAAKVWKNFTNIPDPNIIASGTCGDNLTWGLTKTGKLIIEGTGKMYNYSYYGDLPWYEYHGSIQTITIREGVTSIGNNAFSGCSSLTSITIPDGVTSIGNYSFYNCTNLTTITIPESVTSIGGGAFECCYNLISINITENSQLTSIGNRAFRDCNKLASITIPAGVTDIGSDAYLENSAFFNCGVIKVINYSNLSIEGIKRSTRADLVYQGSELTTVGDYQFYTSDGIHSLVNYIGDDTEIVLPDSYNGENYNIGDYAFYNCSNLTAINIPEGVTGLGSYAFYNCSSLTVITIPASVTTIWTSTFNKCSGLTSIVVAEGNTKYDSRNGCNAIINTSSNKLLVGCSTSVIPESVTIIGDRAFRECESLTAITIPEGVISIGKYAFYRCYNLTDITISASVTGIGDNAFQYCHNLISINITKNSQLTSIGKDAFSFCSKLTSITIPEGVTSIGSVAFYDCSWLNKVINYSNLSLSKGSTGYGYVAYYADIVYRGSELTTVGDYQFYTSDGIHSLVNYVGNDTKIVLPDSYNGENYNIGDWAFGGCSSLTSITIPERMTGIGQYAFAYCSITTINIPNNSKLTSIGSYAFYGCKSLKEITVNCLVAPSLGSYVFGDSSSNYTGRNTYNQGINKLYIPENVTGYNTGQWLDPLQSSEKCGFSIEYIVIDPFNGYEYVDLGLPSGTLWAKCNIGAENETDYGLYFAWGEVEGYNSSQVGYEDNQRSFDGSDYKWKEGEWSCDGSSITKYKPGLDNLTTLLPEDDAASVNMGGSWHMPSKEQLEELINSSYTTTTWTTVNGINGRLITSKTNNNTLFFPASGYFGWGSTDGIGSLGYYWSSSLYEDDYNYASRYTIFSGDIDTYYSTRYYGHTVRGVIG